MKLHRIGREKVDSDLDVIQMVRQLRVTQIELWSLLSRNQHKFANKLGEYVLSEFSSSSGEDKKLELKRWGMKMFNDNKDHHQFIETVVEQNTTINRKLVNIQIDQELRRNHKWARMTKEIAFNNNIR